MSHSVRLGRAPRAPYKPSASKDASTFECLFVLAVCFLLIFLPLVFGIGRAISYQVTGGIPATITVQRRERITTKDSGYYLVFTEGGEVLADRDDLFLWKWNSSDIYGQLHEGHTYRVRLMGHRIRFFSRYRNIVRIDGEVVSPSR